MEKLKIIVDNKDNVRVFMSGKEVKGIKKITFEKDIAESSTHTIEYVTRRS